MNFNSKVWEMLGSDDILRLKPPSASQWWEHRVIQAGLISPGEDVDTEQLAAMAYSLGVSVKAMNYAAQCAGMTTMVIW